MLAVLTFALMATLDGLPLDPAADAPPAEAAPAVAAAAPPTVTTTTTTTVNAEVPKPKPKSIDGAEGATFFGGGRGAIAFPPGGDGPAPMVGLELGVAAEKGVGYGLHLFGASNTPGAPAFQLPSTPYAFGALVDVRYYMQTVPPLRLYPTLSVGFMAGPADGTGKNAVLPLVTPGFGARVNLGPIYTAIEIGAASFYIPFMAFSVGWEPDRAG